ncbi:MAG: hypothetical protein CM15mP46_6270 [Alphaproteobacteria bacterium]|nr:MAG: hypothetical protein CM15mP46_6270 [Alphaproteobacteria bacterium]
MLAARRCYNSTNMAGRGTDIQFGWNLDMRLERARRKKPLSHAPVIKLLRGLLSQKIALDVGALCDWYRTS